MTYRQSGKVDRGLCPVCKAGFKQDEWMIDLFRAESAVEGSARRVIWVHEDCARRALERWVAAKEKKATE
jgi:hypothetical protein